MVYLDQAGHRKLAADIPLPIDDLGVQGYTVHPDAQNFTPYQ